MSTFWRRWQQRHHVAALLSACGVLGTLLGSWTRLGDHAAYTVLQAAQIFDRTLVWLVFSLAAASLITLLVPMHNMRRFAATLAACSWPLWVAAGISLCAGIHGGRLTPGFYLAGAFTLILSASGATTLLSLRQCPALAASRR